MNDRHHFTDPEAFRVALPQLAEGEHYLGALGDELGNLHHVILLPGDNDVANWETQMAWAKSIGGDLPSKTELAMLWGSGREQFQACLYWSNQPYEKDSGYAWFQGFTHGDLLPGHKGAEFRARAVRRVAAQSDGEQRTSAGGDRRAAALSNDELREFLNTVNLLDYCGETITDDATLVRWVGMGLLKCTCYEVTAKGSALVDAAMAAADEPAIELPMQPILVAADGIVRFKENRIVKQLLEAAQWVGYDLNAIALGAFTDDERMQLAQMMGHSVSEYGGLPFVSTASRDRADAIAAAVIAPQQRQEG